MPCPYLKHIWQREDEGDPMSTIVAIDKRKAKRRPFRALWTELGRDRWLRFTLLLPAVIVLLMFSVYPFLYSLYSSLYNYRFGQFTTFAGLGNYERMFADGAFWGSVATTLLFTVVVVPAELILGLALALILVEDVRFRAFYRTAFIIPMVLAPVVVGIIFRLLYNNEFGLPNYILESVLHLPRADWLGNSSLALPGIMFMDIWQWTPFMFLVLLAGLQAIPVDLIEAGRVDGATYLKSLRYVVLPLLRPTMLVALLVRTMDALRIFDQVYVTTQGGPGTSTEVVSFYIYKTAFKFSQITYAAALLVVLMIITLIISVLYIRVMNVSTIAE
jgi:multiple sugar transport system permease protein